MTDDAPLQIDSLWDYDDPAASEARFREALEAVEDRDAAIDVQTQIARAQGLQRKFEEAHAALDAVAKMIPTEEQSVAHVRLLLERGRVFNSSGEAAKARLQFEGAWQMARAIGADALAIDAAHMMAIVEEEPDAALEWNERAIDLAEKSTQPRARTWRGSLLNNTGWTHHDRGDYDTAMRMFERALEARREEGKAKEIRIARWCIGRCMRSLGLFEQALSLQRELLAEIESHAAGEDDGYVHEELAECLTALGRVEEARPHFRRAHAILSGDPWLAEREPQRIARLRELGEE